jgi:hypothetical protein
MHISQPVDDQQLALDWIGGEPLAGSGFESEEPLPEFSDSTESED